LQQPTILQLVNASLSLHSFLSEGLDKRVFSNLQKQILKRTWQMWH